MADEPMHKKLKFSFGHIIAFLALMALGYVFFMSATYFTQGNYLIGGIVAIVTTLILLMLLFRLQLLKAVNRDFEKKVIHERISLLVFIVACSASFLIFSHFWTVKSREAIIQQRFSQAAQSSRKLFNDYDLYASKRIALYNSTVNKTYINHDSIVPNVLKKGLRLQLFPPQFNSLKDNTGNWLQKYDKSFSVWNVFLIGNIDNICQSMSSWNSMMEQMSQHLMNDEDPATAPFSEKGLIDKSTTELREVLTLYSQISFPLPMSWITGSLFLLLFLPWLIQRRSNKSMVTLWGKRELNIANSHTGSIENISDVQVSHHSGSIDELGTTATTHRSQQLNTEDNNQSNSSSSGHSRRAMSLDLDDDE